MQLSDQLLTTFQELYKRHYGKEITKAQALTESAELIRFVAATNNLNNLHNYEKLHNERHHACSDSIHHYGRVPKSDVRKRK